MQKISGFIERKIAPIATKISRQRYIQAITNAFLMMIPFITIGSFALIVISPPVDYKTLHAGFGQSFFHGWANLASALNFPLGAIYMMTMGAMALYTTVGIAYFLAKHYKMNPFLPVVLTLGGFLITSAVTMKGTFDATYLDGKGLFAGMFIALVTVEAYRFMVNQNFGHIEIAGGGVPPALSESLATMAPVLVVLLGDALIAFASYALTKGPFPLVMQALLAPIVKGVNSGWGIVGISLLVMILWWFGIHDSVITSPLGAFLVANLSANSTAFAHGVASTSLPYVVTEPFWWNFMALGGSGATISIAILAAFSKSKQIRTVGRIALIPSFFNINEPLIFGLPLMYNPTMMIPFVLVMPMNALLTYLAMTFKLIGRTFADPSWNMIPGIGAFLSTMDLRALIFVLGLIVLDAVIYFPFFKIYEKSKIKEELAEQQ